MVGIVELLPPHPSKRPHPYCYPRLPHPTPPLPPPPQPPTPPLPPTPYPYPHPYPHPPPQEDPEVIAQIDAAFNEVIMHHFGINPVDAGDPDDSSGSGDDSSHDDSSDYDGVDSDDVAEEAGIQRAVMHCALREHSVRFVHSTPIMHAGVRARTHHHQTADALAFVPRPGGRGSGAGGSRSGGGGCGDVDDCGGMGGAYEDVIVAGGSRLALWRLGVTPDGVSHPVTGRVCGMSHPVTGRVCWDASHGQGKARSLELV